MKKIALAAFSATALLALSACGGDATTDEATDAAAEATDAAAVATDAAATATDAAADGDRRRVLPRPRPTDAATDTAARPKRPSKPFRDSPGARAPAVANDEGAQAIRLARPSLYARPWLRRWA
jgi:hypothetical protein